MKSLTDVAVERAILSALIQHGKIAYLDVSDLLSSSSFTLDANKSLYSILCNIYQNNIDAKVDYHLILSTSKDLKLLNDITEDDKYIRRIIEFPSELSNVRQLAQKIKKLELTRTLTQKLNDASLDLLEVTGSETLSEIISKAESPIINFVSELTTSQYGGVEHISDGLNDYIGQLESGEKPKIGLSSGFSKYDKAIGYLRPGVHVIFARKKVGKSFFAINTALNSACKEKIPTILLDTELRKENGQWSRMLSRIGSVTINNIEDASYIENPIYKDRIRKAAKMLYKAPLDYLNITGKNFDEVISILRRWVMQKVGFNQKGKINDCLIIYDYLKLTSSKGLEKITEWQELGFRMQTLHDFTVQYNCPCLTFAQANREMELAASDRVSWFATSVCNFQKKEPDEIAEDGFENGNRKLIVEDVRFGEGLEDGDYINFIFENKIAKLTEGKTRNQLGRERNENRLQPEQIDDDF